MNNEQDPEITFNNGICNHCFKFAIDDKRRKLEKQKLPWVIYDIKKQKGKYQCLLGLSGGVDSSLCLHYLVEHGVKPLCFSVDTGDNTKEADENVMRMVEGLKVPFIREVIDIPKFRELREAFIKSGLKNIEVTTDHILMAKTYEMAKKYGIKYIVSGGNLATEAIMPPSYGYNAFDLTHLKGVYKTITGKRLVGLPTISLLGYIYNRFILKIKNIYLLDYYEYNRDKAVQVLYDKYGYKSYGNKHCESYFTKWFQESYLPQKFGLDKRYPHYSTLINSGQMTRQEALEELKKPLNPPSLWETDVPIKDYKDYPNSEFWWKLFYRIYAKIKTCLS